MLKINFASRISVNMASLLIAALLAAVSFASPVQARTIALAWDANTEPDVAGYKLYYRADSSTVPFNGTGAIEGPSPINIGKTTTATLSGLPDNRDYYITVTAYNSSGQESTFSNIVASAAIVSDGSGSPDPGSGNGTPDSVVAEVWTPFLWYPTNGAVAEATPVQLDWEPLPAGSQATFTLYYGTDPYLGASGVAANVVTPLGQSALLAGACLFGGVGLAKRRRQLLLMLSLVLLSAGSLLTGCGGGGGGTSGSTIPATLEDGGAGTQPETLSVQVYEGLEDNTFLAGDLRPGTTYYWKVVSIDGQTRVESDIYSFTTKAN